MRHEQQDPRWSQGFTLVEMMVTVAIIGLMAAMSIGGISRMMPRVRGTRSMDMLVAALRQAPRQAVNNRADIWVGFENPAGVPGPSYRFVVYEDWNGNFAPLSFDFNTPGFQIDREVLLEGKRLDRLLLIGELSDAVTFQSKSLLTTATTKIPDYFTSAINGADTGVTKGCSICNGADTMIWLHYAPDGDVTVPSAPTAKAAALILGLDGRGLEGSRRVVVIAIPSGLMEEYLDG